jgi:serine protease Do
MKTLFRFFIFIFCAQLTAQPLLFDPDEEFPLANVMDIPADVIARVDPSVVSIQHERAGGTGFIISKDGYILTNGHVVRGFDDEDPTRPAQQIIVVLHNEQQLPATVIGFSMDPDVALLRVDHDEPLQPVTFANSRNVSVGQRCFAVGTPVGLRRTFTSGILSNIDRTDLGTETIVFQTDAAINPGNSGGPLFDQQGRVLGINTYASRGANNIGFTIPIHVALDMIDDFKQYGRFVRSLVPLFFTGELYSELARALEVDRGILISFVMADSAAWEAGLRPGDILTHVNGEPVHARTRADLLNFEWEHAVRPAGEPFDMTVLRGPRGEREEINIPAVLEPLPPIPAFGRHLGEIPEYRYATLGLGVKSLVDLHLIIHDLHPVEGVFVKFREDNSTASQADIQAQDIITHVAGEATPDFDTFLKIFERELQAHNPAIELRIARNHVRIFTALAPDYLLRETRVVLIAPDEDHEYVDLMRRELLAAGAEVRLATPGSVPIARDLLEGRLYPDLALEDVDVKEADVILFAGGPGSRAFWENGEALRIAREAMEHNRHLAAAGPSALLPVLASEEPLEKKITLPREDSAEAVRRQANYTGKDTESDGRIHTTTARTREVVREFLTSLQQAVLRAPVRTP